MAKKKIDIKEIALAVLCFRKGYRVLSFFFWFFLLGLISIPIEYASKKEYQQQAEDRNYQRRCAEGDFVGARAIRDELYTSYTKKLGQWRSGEWCDREAIQRQEIYRAAAAYIFGQEMTAIYAKACVDDIVDSIGGCTIGRRSLQRRYVLRLQTCHWSDARHRSLRLPVVGAFLQRSLRAGSRIGIGKRR